PEWLKYGPIDRITGVRLLQLKFFGWRTSTWSVVPSRSVKKNCFQLAPACTYHGWAASAAGASTRPATTRGRSLAMRMFSGTTGPPRTCRNPGRGQTSDRQSGPRSDLRPVAPAAVRPQTRRTGRGQTSDRRRCAPDLKQPRKLGRRVVL